MVTLILGVVCGECSVGEVKYEKEYLGFGISRGPDMLCRVFELIFGSG
jgi:hypothetical protein